MKDRAMRIGEAARLTGVSPDTLRHYERNGLIEPAIRTNSGYRLYSPHILEQIRAVRSALALGFTISELSRILRIRREGGTPCAQVRSLAEEKLMELDRRIREMNDLRSRLRSVIRRWDRIMKATLPGEHARLLHTLAATSKTGETT